MGSNLMSISGLGPKNCPQASCKGNFELPFQFCVLLTNQKHVKFLCSKKHFFQVTVNEINFLVEISSRWGLTQGLYPIRGPKIVQGPYVNEISNFSSSTVGNSSTFLSVLSKQSRTKQLIGNGYMYILRNKMEFQKFWQDHHQNGAQTIVHRLHAKEISNFLSSSVHY